MDSSWKPLGNIKEVIVQTKYDFKSNKRSGSPSNMLKLNLQLKSNTLSKNEVRYIQHREQIYLPDGMGRTRPFGPRNYKNSYPGYQKGFLSDTAGSSTDVYLTPMSEFSEQIAIE